MRTFMVMFWAGCAAAGCGYYGDSTPGETGRSSWRIDDGLCPGTEGGCAMTVPVAAGVELAVDADVECARPRRDSEGRVYAECDLAEFGVDVVGPAELRALSGDTSAGRLDLRLYTVAPGEVSLELLRRGEDYDRARLRVREAAGLECGRVLDGASWDMRSISTNGSYTVSLYGTDRVTHVELGCRVVDTSGAPLFSASGIVWQILEGSARSTVDDGGLFGGSASTGARVYVRLEDTGTIRLEARFGGLARQVEIIVR